MDYSKINFLYIFSHKEYSNRNPKKKLNLLIACCKNLWMKIYLFRNFVHRKVKIFRNWFLQILRKPIALTRIKKSFIKEYNWKNKNQMIVINDNFIKILRNFSESFVNFTKKWLIIFEEKKYC